MRQLLLVLISLLYLGFSFQAFAIKDSDVIVSGNERIAKEILIETISNLIVAEPSGLDLDAIVKALYGTQLFSEVAANVQSHKLHITVKENPIVANIVFKGNAKQPYKDLKEVIRTRPLSILKKEQLNQDVATLVAHYKQQGMFNVQVNTELKNLEGGKVDVVFNVQEGNKVKIRRIDFVDNKAFSEQFLRKAILSKTFSLFNLMSESHYYIPDRVEADKAALRDLYMRSGYMDFNVTHVSADLSRDDAYLSFVLHEGRRYQIGTVGFESMDIQEQLIEDLRTLVSVKSGDSFNSYAINNDVKEISNFLNAKGYFFAQVEPDYKPAGNVVDVTYRIAKGKKVYINRINILGNNRTKDTVIRKYLLVSEGDPLNPIKVENSKRRLMNTKFFAEVAIEVNYIDSNRVDLNVVVQEQSTGSLQFSAGFSSDMGLVGMLGLREKNFLGTGDEVHLSVERSALDFNGNLGMAKHHLVNSDLSVGVNLFKQSLERAYESSYDSDSKGIVLWSEFPFNQRLTLGVRYTYTDTDISVLANAAPVIQQMKGNSVVSNLGYSLTYSDVEGGLNPNKGYHLNFSQDVAGLGGNVHYLRSEFQGTYFVPILEKLAEDIIYRSTLRIGHIFDYLDDSLKVAYNFFLGAYDVRGFGPAGIGPRDIKLGDALGGKTYLVWSHQVSIPLMKGLEELDKFGIRGIAFVDVATLTAVDYKGPTIYDDARPRVSVGLGLSWSTPFGPMGIDFGFPIVKSPHDRTQMVRFSLGKAF